MYDRDTPIHLSLATHSFRTPEIKTPTPNPVSKPTADHSGISSKTQLISAGVNSGPWPCKPVFITIKVIVSRPTVKPQNKPVIPATASHFLGEISRPPRKRFQPRPAPTVATPTASKVARHNRPSKLIQTRAYRNNNADAIFNSGFRAGNLITCIIAEGQKRESRFPKNTEPN